MKVTQSSSGCYVPLHLLEFEGDTALLAYYRQILHTNYENRIVKHEAGVCENCYTSLTFNDRPRMQPGHKMTCKIRKALLKSKERRLGKYKAYLMKRYLRSSSNLIVQCRFCHHVNKRSIATSELKQATKNNLLSKLAHKSQTECPSVGKKKKMKKKKKEDVNCGLIISPQLCPSTPAETSMETSLAATSRMATRATSSNSRDELKQTDCLTPVLPSKPFASSEDTPRKGSNQVVSKVEPGLQAFNSKPFDKERRSNVSLSGVKTGNSAQKRLTPKGLKQFLSQDESTSSPGPMSLTDFLSSL